MAHPWDWYIYLYIYQQNPPNVGINTSYLDPMDNTSRNHDHLRKTNPCTTTNLNPLCAVTLQFTWVASLGFSSWEKVEQNISIISSKPTTSGWFQRIWKILVKIGSCPQVGLKINKYLKPPPSTISRWMSPQFFPMPCLTGLFVISLWLDSTWGIRQTGFLANFEA